MSPNARFAFLIVVVIGAVLAVWIAVHPRDEHPTEQSGVKAPTAGMNELSFPESTVLHDETRSPSLADGKMRRATAPLEADGLTNQGEVLNVRDEAMVVGRVVTPSKDPVAGASLHLGDDVKLNPVAYTDSEGRFEIKGIGDGELLVNAVHPDYLPGSARVRPVRGATVEVEITVGEGGVIEGTVLQAGEPLSGEVVTAFRLTGSRFLKEATTDPAGRYAIKGVPPGEMEVIVQIRLVEGNAPIRLQRKAAVEQEGVTIVDFHFPASLGTIEGMVTVNGELPAEGRVKLTVTSADGDSLHTATVRGDGFYSMERVAPGSGWLEAIIVSQSGGQLRKGLEVTVGEGQQLRQDIAFDAQSAIYGTVSGFGSGRAGVVIAVQGDVDVNPGDVAQLLKLERTNVSQAQIREDGTYRLEEVPPGDYTIVAIMFDAQADTSEETVVTTRATTSPVTLQKGQQLQADLAP